MQIQYQLTANDFWQSTLLWRRARPMRKWSFRVLPILCTILAGLSLISIAQNPQYRSASPVLIAGILMMVYAWGRPRLNARKRAEMPSSKVLVTLDASDAGLRFFSAIEDSKVSWSAFVRWAEGDGVFALFLSPNAPIPIPKRALTAKQQAEFREILRCNIVAK